MSIADELRAEIAKPFTAGHCRACTRPHDTVLMLCDIIDGLEARLASWESLGLNPDGTIRKAATS